MSVLAEYVYTRGSLQRVLAEYVYHEANVTYHAADVSLMALLCNKPYDWLKTTLCKTSVGES